MKNKFLPMIFGLIFLMSPLWADQPQSQDVDPIQRLMQTARDNDSRILAKHQDIAKYFDAFVPAWRAVLSQLSKPPGDNQGLEALFAWDEQVIHKSLPTFHGVKPPGDFKDFHEAFSKGLEALGDWCESTKNRIHYATTQYQKDAYMKRIQAFQNEWYDGFFGPAVDEFNSAWAIYVTNHWGEDLDPKVLRTIERSRDLNRYLSGFHKVMAGHLKNVGELERKAREAKDSDDPGAADKVTENLHKEVADLGKTVAELKRMNPPPEFKEFHDLQVSWLELARQGSQKLLEIDEANQNHVSTDRIQDLMNEKNIIDEKSTGLRADIDKAYEKGLQALAQ